MIAGVRPSASSIRGDFREQKRTTSVRLVTSIETAMEHLTPESVDPPPHVPDHGEELVYILHGEMAMWLGEHTIAGTKGQFVRVPAGIPHAFAVKSQRARVVNFYVPACLDMQVAMLGARARAPMLPSDGAQRAPTDEQQQAFAARLHDLATQRIAPLTDLFARYRADPAQHQCASDHSALQGRALRSLVSVQIVGSRLPHENADRRRDREAEDHTAENLRHSSEDELVGEVLRGDTVALPGFCGRWGGLVRSGIFDRLRDGRHHPWSL
jgi:mannose-6-phosphate isomerase-like protein (cupin superfamily)